MAADHSAGDAWRDARAHKGVATEPGPSFEAVEPGHRGRTRQPKRSEPQQALAMAAPTPPLAVDEALKEIATVPPATLHRAAGFAWATRAIACYRACLGKRDLQEALSYLYLGEHYREAALAHAALGEAWEPMYAQVDAAMAQDREEASSMTRRRSPLSAATP
ncbi:MAG: hypothetical protein AABY18_07760 [Candidatus Thermoplasmatota archaeon]